jgi:hypothetical protein
LELVPLKDVVVSQKLRSDLTSIKRIPQKQMDAMDIEGTLVQPQR